MDFNKAQLHEAILTNSHMHAFTINRNDFLGKCEIIREITFKRNVTTYKAEIITIIESNMSLK